MQRTLESLAAPFKLQESNPEEGTFSGLASVFDKEFETENGRTVIERGAFAESLKARPEVPVLWQHEAMEPIGLVKQMEESEEGLVVRGQLSATTRGKDARTLLRDRVIRDLSIGFDKRESHQGTPRRLKALDLFEVSLVTWGAAGPLGARVREVNRAAAPSALAGAFRRVADARLRSARRNGYHEVFQEPSDEDRRQMVQLALLNEFGGEDVSVWVEAMFAGEVVFELRKDGDGAGLFRVGFALNDEGVSFAGEPVPVRRVTMFEPLT